MAYVLGVEAVDNSGSGNSAWSHEKMCIFLKPMMSRYPFDQYKSRDELNAVAEKMPKPIRVAVERQRSQIHKTMIVVKSLLLYNETKFQLKEDRATDGAP